MKTDYQKLVVKSSTFFLLLFRRFYRLHDKRSLTTTPRPSRLSSIPLLLRYQLAHHLPCLERKTGGRLPTAKTHNSLPSAMKYRIPKLWWPASVSSSWLNVQTELHTPSTWRFFFFRHLTQRCTESIDSIDCPSADWTESIQSQLNVQPSLIVRSKDNGRRDIVQMYLEFPSLVDSRVNWQNHSGGVWFNIFVPEILQQNFLRFFRPLLKRIRFFGVGHL